MSAVENTPSENDQAFVPSGPRLVPSGAVANLDPDTWYYLKATYIDDHGNPQVGYFHPVGSTPSESFWDYIVMSPSLEGACQFQMQNIDGGAAQWLIKADGNHLCLKATGWFYRASYYTSKFWISDGKLYNDYWGGPAGAVYRSFLVSSGYYVGQGLGDSVELTNCELVPA